MRLTLTLLAAVALLSFPGIAQACGPEAYMTPEELASGAYDTTPAPWERGVAHTHSPTPPEGGGAVADAPPAEAPAPPDAPTNGGDRPADSAPGVGSQTAQTPSAEGPRTGSPPGTGAQRSATPQRAAAAHQHPHPQSSPSVARPPVAGLVKQPVRLTQRTSSTAPAKPTKRAADRAERAGANAMASGRASIRPEPRPAASEAPADRRSPGSSSPGTMPTIALMLLGLAVAGGLTVVLARRRRGDDPSAAQPTGAEPDGDGSPGSADLEAELQEILAEEHARATRAAAHR